MANKKQKTRGNWQKLHKNANKIEFFSVSEWRWKKYLHRYNANKKHIEVNTLRDILKWCWFHNSTKMFDINFYSIGFSKILKLCEVRNILSVEDFLKKKTIGNPLHILCFECKYYMNQCQTWMKRMEEIKKNVKYYQEQHKKWIVEVNELLSGGLCKFLRIF